MKPFLIRSKLLAKRDISAKDNRQEGPTLNQIVPGVVASFRQDLQVCLDGLSDSGLSPVSLCGFVADQKAAVEQAGLGALTQGIGELDTREKLIHRDGVVMRFKFDSLKEWLTPFGLARIHRRLLQADHGGPSVAPLGEACGMVARYMTPDVEEMSAYATAMIVPREVGALLGMVLPQGPSATAAQRVLQDVGSFVESKHEVIEDETKEHATSGDSGPVRNERKPSGESTDTCGATMRGSNTLSSENAACQSEVPRGGRVQEPRRRQIEAQRHEMAAPRWARSAQFARLDILRAMGPVLPNVPARAQHLGVGSVERNLHPILLCSRSNRVTSPLPSLEMDSDAPETAHVMRHVPPASIRL